MRVRRLVLGLTALPVLGLVLALVGGIADAAPVFAATASASGGPQYLGDSAGTAFTFTVTNTGTETTIGAVEIQRPTVGWVVTSCSTATAGWTVQSADPRCRYRSAAGAADDILPGESRTFTVTVVTAVGTADRTGTWGVTVSKSNQFDQPSLLTAAEATANALRATTHTWQVLDAVVTSAAVSAGSPCPASDKDEQTSAVVTMVVCGRNRATAPLTPAAAHSSLGGTFLAAPGTFSSNVVVPGTSSVVLGSWTGARVTARPGFGTVVARVGSAANETSPGTTLTGYEAINAAPTAAADAYSVVEDSAFSIAAPGVLANDTDPENQPLSAQLDTAPAHAQSFDLHSDGGFTYTPAADFSGTDSFRYRATDGTSVSPPATVTITVTAVNDTPVNTVPGSVNLVEDTTYAFGAGALRVADVDAGSGDVEVRLTAADAAVSTGTTGVTVTGNGTGAVTVTGSLSAVNAALDVATIVPAKDFAGETTLTMATSDLGHTGVGGARTDTDSVALNVAGVNDAPSFTAGPAQTSLEDAGLVSVASWATDLSAGAANESGQALTFTVTTDNPALFQTAPAVSPAGALTYRAAPDAYGAATVTVTLSDNGGTADGGSDTSAPATFTITVNAVNDAPTAADHARSAQANMAVHVSGLLAGASDARDSGQASTTVSLGTVTPLSCAGCTIANVASDGSFDLTPPPGFTGTATLRYTVVDDGYPAPGVSSAPATITVNVLGPVIWFADGSVPGPGTGTLTDPFKSLASAAAAASAPGARIFVASGNVSGGVTLPDGGWLVGQGVTGTSFDDVFGITPPAGTAARPSINGVRPVVAGGVVLADDSAVRGLDLTAPSGTTTVAGTGADRVTVSEVSVSATGARAVDVSSSQGSTFTFDGVSATGGPGGIRLATVNTTSPGSVTVSGGMISGTSGDGVSLSSVGDVALFGLTVRASGVDGIGATGVTDFAATDVAVYDSRRTGVSLAGSFGTAELTRLTASGSGGDNARVLGSAGTASVTVTDSDFADTNAATGGNGLLVEASGTSALTLTATGNDFRRNNQAGLALRALSAQPMSATVTATTVEMDDGAGIDVVANGAGGLAYTIDRGSVTGCPACGVPVNVYKATGATGARALSGTISNLTVSNGSSPNAPGIWVHGEGAGGQRVLVTGNTVVGVGHVGILAAAGNGSSALDATITGNTVTLGAGGLQGIQVDSGTLSGDTTAVCADIRTNTVSSPTSDVRVRNRQAGTTFRLPGYTGPATSTTDVVSFEIAQNTITDAAAVVGSSPGFAGGAVCAAP